VIVKRPFAVATLLAVLLLSPASAGAVVPGHEAPMVGIWGQTHRCQQLVDALNELSLGELAPGVVGDFFPDQTFDELAAKPDLCSGARPQRHFHFFTWNWLFGSFDQRWNLVDYGPWTMVDSNTFRIRRATFDFRIRGDTLALTPRITQAQRDAALSDPKTFSTAGWMVAVSYPGTRWEGLPCDWC
jgi:hypothetical protein